MSTVFVRSLSIICQLNYVDANINMKMKVILERLIDLVKIKSNKNSLKSDHNNSVLPKICNPPFDQLYRDFSMLSTLITNEKRTYLKEDRLYNLWQALINVKELQGDCIEIGTFRGGSAKFIGAANRLLCKENVKLMVLDTFEGHPECIDEDIDRVDIHYIGKFNNTSYSEVLHYLKDYEEIKVHRGDCMNLLAELKLDKIKFVHIDVDLFKPILHCLKVLDNYLVRSGVIVVDDYSASTCPGVEKAIKEFLADHNNYSLWFFRTEQAVLIKN